MASVAGIEQALRDIRKLEQTLSTALPSLHAPRGARASREAPPVDDAEGDELDSLGDERPDGSKCCSL